MNIKDMGGFILEIDRCSIERMNYKTIDEIIEMFKGKGTSGRETIDILIEGYEEDARELFEIPEVRSYIQGLFNRHPYLCYLLYNKEIMGILLLCLNTIREVKNTGSDNIRIEILLNPHVCTKILIATMVHSGNVGDAKEVTRAVCNRMNEVLGIERLENILDKYGC